MKHRDFAATADEVRSAAEWAGASLAACGLDPARRNLAELAVAEAFMNIVRHGYAGSPGVIRAIVRGGPGVAAVELDDDAPLFDPARHVPRARSGNEQHGMGNMIIRDAVDELRYENRDGRNHLELVFRIGA